MRARNFPPTEALSPETLLKLLIEELAPMAIIVDVNAADCRSCVLRVVIAAPAVWMFLFKGNTNAATDKMMDRPFPIKPIMNTARTIPETRSMIDSPCFPKAGTLLKNGTVILAAPINVELDTVLVKFCTTERIRVSSVISLHG